MEDTSYNNLLNKIKKLEKENKTLKEEVFSLKNKIVKDPSQETQPNFRHIIDSISETIYVQDKNGYFLEVNQAAEKMYGHPRKSFIGKTPEFLAAPGKNDLEFIKTVVQKAYKGKPQRFEFWGIDKNGKIIPKEVTLTQSTYMGQKAVIAVGRDITENLQAKKELQDRERKFNTLINNLPGMVYRCKNDENWTMTYVSPGIEKLTGYKPGDLIYNKKISYNEIVYKDDRKKVWNEIQKALHGNTQFTVTYRIKDAGGNIKWVWEQGQGIYDNHNQKTFSEGFISDITEHKKQEEKINEQAAKIDAILNTMPDLLFVFDRKGNYTDVYANNHNKLALPRNELIGKNLSEVFSKTEAQRIKSSIQACLDTGELQTLEYQIELEGNPMFFEARLSPLNKNQILSIVRDITISKQNEKALKQAEENFRHTLDVSPMGIRVVTEDYQTLYANQAIVDILGYNNTEELINNPIKEQYTHESYKEFLVRKEQREKGYKVPSEYEISIVRKDGKIRHLTVYRKEILWNNEKQILVIYRDTTQQKQAEKALKESEERFRSIYQNSSLGLYRTTPGGQILLANPALVKMLGYKSFDELAKRNVANEKHFSKKTPRSDFIKLVEDKNEVVGYETQWKHKDGSLIHVRESAKAIKDNNGKTIYYDGTVEDITKHKHAEQALKESEEKFRVLVENAFNGIYLIDDRNFEYVNNRFCEITGYSREELTLGNFDFNTLLTEKGKDIVETWYKARKKGVKKPAVYETQIRNKKGEIIDVEVITMGIEISGKSKVLGLVRDITERKHSQKLKEEIAVAKKSLEFKKNFLANMSHEIRTPLTGIIGMAEILSKTKLTKDQKEYLNSLIYSTESLREIINQILDYSKIEAGEMHLKHEKFAICNLFNNAKTLFGSICDKNIKLETYIDPDLPEYIKADEQRISQVIYNLISNAVKFTHKGRIVFRAKPETQIDSEGYFTIRIEVEDTGVGVSPELKKHIYQPFLQAEEGSTRQFEGTGLGLTICKHLSKMLGGQIDYSSQTGEGSLFWFTFKAQVTDAPKSKESKIKPETQKSLKPLKILHVEDKLLNQKVVTILLESLGHEVITANNGLDALDIYPQENFDMILMDIQMPHMDGVTATKELRKKYSNLPPIVGLSANAFEGDREKYINLGMDEYLTKPVKEEDLKNIIKSFEIK